MEQDLFMREFPFYYPDMTAEDYLYIRHHVVKTKLDIKDWQMNGKLLPVKKRTKEYIFKVLGLDMDYVLDESML